MKIPETADKAFSSKYFNAGFAECIGSMDAYHVLIKKARHDLKQIHLGYKLPGTANTYNIVMTNRRKILCSMYGKPSCWNDKSLVKFDQLCYFSS